MHVQQLWVERFTCFKNCPTSHAHLIPTVCKLEILQKLSLRKCLSCILRHEKPLGSIGLQLNNVDWWFLWTRNRSYAANVSRKQTHRYTLSKDRQASTSLQLSVRKYFKAQIMVRAACCHTCMLSSYPYYIGKICTNKPHTHIHYILICYLTIDMTLLPEIKSAVVLVRTTPWSSLKPNSKSFTWTMYKHGARDCRKRTDCNWRAKTMRQQNIEKMYKTHK